MQLSVMDSLIYYQTVQYFSLKATEMFKIFVALAFGNKYFKMLPSRKVIAKRFDAAMLQ